MVVNNPPDLAGYLPGSGLVVAGAMRTWLLVPPIRPMLDRVRTFMQFQSALHRTDSNNGVFSQTRARAAVIYRRSHAAGSMAV